MYTDRFNMSLMCVTALPAQEELALLPHAVKKAKVKPEPFCDLNLSFAHWLAHELIRQMIGSCQGTGSGSTVAFVIAAWVWQTRHIVRQDCQL